MDKLSHLLIIPERLTIVEDVHLGYGDIADVFLAKLDESSRTRDVAVKQLRTGWLGGDRVRLGKVSFVERLLVNSCLNQRYSW